MTSVANIPWSTPLNTTVNADGTRTVTTGPGSYLTFDKDGKMVGSTSPAVPQIQNIPFLVKRGIKLKRATDIVEIEQQWLIDDIIPDMQMTAIVSMPGIGKSTFANALLAHFSKDYPVIMLTNEDSESNIRKQFRGFGGTLPNFYVEDSEADDIPWMLHDSKALEETIVDIKPRLICIDSLFTHLGGTVDSNQHAKIAPLLVNLRKLSNKYCPIIVIHHDNKSLSIDPMKRAAGSQGIAATFRHNIRIDPHPDDESIRVVSVFKTNVGDPNAMSLQYTISPFKWFTERSPLTARELVDGEVIEKGRQAQSVKFENAKAFIVAQLQSGSRLADEVMTQAVTQQGFSESMMKRAKLALGVHSRKTNDVWYWDYVRKNI